MNFVIGAELEHVGVTDRTFLGGCDVSDYLRTGLWLAACRYIYAGTRFFDMSPPQSGAHYLSPNVATGQNCKISFRRRRVQIINYALKDTILVTVWASGAELRGLKYGAYNFQDFATLISISMLC